MGFEKVGGEIVYKGAYKEEGAKGKLKFKQGEILVEGHYIGRHPNKFKPEAPHFKFKNEAGQNVVLNHAGHLGYIMENEVVEGDFVRVTYAEHKELTSGTYKGKKSHAFEVGIDRERSKDMGVIPSTPKEEAQQEQKSLDVEDFDPSAEE